MIFALNYNILYDFNNAFGAFFWKKGRANIVIIEPRAKKLNILISKELEEYTEERVW